jgi:catechol 2,3-dioxygenase-like lactoylglutathione lyase family enzyme
MNKHDSPVSRRTIMGLALALPFVARSAGAQSESASVASKSQLPLRTTGLEHMGTVVPDVAAAGKFYGRVFNPELHKEKDPPLRYYVTLNPGYLAFGSRENARDAFFDHFCALVTDYDRTAMAEELKGQGLPAGRFGIIPDPDDIGLQLLPDPAGLAKTTEPAGRIVDGDALLKPRGLDAVILRVADPEASAQFYRKFFGRERPAANAGEMWFQVAGTELGLVKVKSGEAPRVDHIRVKVEKFGRKAVTRELEKLGARVTNGSTKDSLRFTDPVGLSVELKPA